MGAENLYYRIHDLEKYSVAIRTY